MVAMAGFHLLHDLLKFLLKFLHQLSNMGQVMMSLTIMYVLKVHVMSDGILLGT